MLLLLLLLLLLEAIDAAPYTAK